MHPAILRAVLLLALTPSASSAQTEFPFAAGTDSTGRAQAVSDAAGRVLIESPEFPRGLWVDLVDEAGQALAGIQVEYEGHPDSLVGIRCVDRAGLRQETLLWTRPGGDPLRLALRPGEPADLPAGLALIEWQIDPSAGEVLDRVDMPQLAGWEDLTAFLQERWQGRTGRVAAQVDSSTALAIDLDHPEWTDRLIEYLEEWTRSSLGEAIASLVQVLLTTHTFDRDLALFEDSIVLTTSFVLVPGSELERWVLPELGRSRGPVTLSEAAGLVVLDLRSNKIEDVSPLTALTRLWRLRLSGNRIVDVSPLASLTNLRELSLSSNEIVDVSPLTALTRLYWLELSYNEIIDVSPLAALTDLSILDLNGNEIIDVSALAPLSSLESLSLDDNLIDVSPLAALTNLERLYLGDNAILDVSALASLSSLESLWLDDNLIIDVSPLANLTSLEWLVLSNNHIRDIRPLVANSGLGGGDWVCLEGNPLSDQAINEQIPALRARGVDVDY